MLQLLLKGMCQVSVDVEVYHEFTQKIAPNKIYCMDRFRLNTLRKNKKWKLKQ